MKSWDWPKPPTIWPVCWFWKPVWLRSTQSCTAAVACPVILTLRMWKTGLPYPISSRRQIAFSPLTSAGIAPPRDVSGHDRASLRRIARRQGRARRAPIALVSSDDLISLRRRGGLGADRLDVARLRGQGNVGCLRAATRSGPRPVQQGTRRRSAPAAPLRSTPATPPLSSCRTVRPGRQRHCLSAYQLSLRCATPVLRDYRASPVTDP